MGWGLKKYSFIFISLKKSYSSKIGENMSIILFSRNKYPNTKFTKYGYFATGKLGNKSLKFIVQI